VSAASDEDPASLVAELERTRAELAQKEAERQRVERLVAMGTMVAGFAHEVRNPLAVLRSIAEELLEEHGDTAVVQSHVPVMLQMVERIERLVRMSLRFGRPAAPARSLHRPEAIVASALAEVQHRVRTVGGEIRVEVARDLSPIDVDDAQLAQALVILLLNALDATGHASRVMVRVAARRTGADVGTRKSDPPLGPAISFDVVDEGGGIPAEILGRIFDPFFTTKANGTGLGLAIAAQIVSENGARLGVSSTTTATTFTITVPTLVSE